ncbi:CRISPR-associated endonuclease Cas2 [Pyramidobacter piscolens]|uniref:CRISPR-associated endonuclease Cas2 n=1 Tax=Pyramidobacter piscolens TaxID=638849 RepID=UPI0026657206|nr:CRISPR-associated endonuclease Cas2 [Pyramidobacter piscolens]
MRIMVFFDLPVTTKKKRRDYTRFRKFLTTDGYDMLQFSVYSRIVNGEDAVDKHLKRLRSNLPPEGSVRFLQITERQYAAMKLLLGNQTPREKFITTQMTLEF